MSSQDVRMFVDSLAGDNQHVSLIARVSTEHAGGTCAATLLPPSGTYPVPGPPEGIVRIGREVFRGTVGENFTIEFYSAEPEEHERPCHNPRAVQGRRKKWIGEYGPSDQARGPDDVGDWQLC